MAPKVWARVDPCVLEVQPKPFVELSLRKGNQNMKLGTKLNIYLE